MSIADRVKDTSTSTGTGNFALSGSAPSGFQSLSAIGAVGATFGYVIDGGSEWEVGTGTITAANTFSRLPSASSNSGLAVNFSAGTKTVFHSSTAAILSRGLVDPDDVGYDIIIYAGQSNAEGRGLIDTLNDLPDPRVWQYTSDSRNAPYQKIVVGNDPNYNIYYAGWSGNGLNTGNMSMMTVACKVYASTRPANRKVLYVPLAVGGTPLVASTAPWAVGNGLYAAAVTQANAAVTAAQSLYPNSRVVGFMWHQGEGDAANSVTQAAYTAALTALIAGFRSSITGAANAWFIIAGMAPESFTLYGANWTNINAAHQAVALAVSGCMYVAGPSGYTADNLHYNAAGSRIIGTRIGLAIRAASQYSAAPVAATAVTLAGPATGLIGTASSNFTVSISGVITGTVRVTPNDGGAGGTFTPAFLDLLTGTVSGTFTYAAASSGAKTISMTNNGGLANPSALTFTVAAAASAITLARSAASGVVSTGVTITVGTNNPLTGSQTESVALSSDIAGTWSVNPVALSAGTATATSVFTPSATGSATITGTATGTPTLANGTIGYTVNASATAPATMAAPTATQTGATTANVVLVAPSDGGSAITGYTVTSIPAGGVDTNAGTTALTHAMTGLTTGTPVTFTAAATNTVGTSAASPPSNSVTPVAPAATTLNPSDKNAAITLSNANLTATLVSPTTWADVRATVGKAAGKWYWEAKYVTGTGRGVIGVGNATASLAALIGGDANGWGLYATSGALYHNNANALSGTPSTFTANDVIGIALDMDAGTIRFYKNNTVVGSSAASGIAGTFFPMVGSDTNGDVITMAFTTAQQLYAAPSGFTAIG